MVEKQHPVLRTGLVLGLQVTNLPQHQVLLARPRPIRLGEGIGHPSPHGHRDHHPGERDGLAGGRGVQQRGEVGVVQAKVGHCRLTLPEADQLQR